MIPKNNRFAGRNSLNYTYKTGQTARSDKLSLKMSKSNREDYRLAVVVSKKVSKSAVVRNRIRRRIYEYFRRFRLEYGEPIKFDIIISVFDESFATMPADRLDEVCKKLLGSISKR